VQKPKTKIDAFESEAVKQKKAELEKNNRKLYWAMFAHVNTRGKRMDFEKFPFLPEIYSALNKYRKVSVQKCVQVGISEAFIISHLDEAERGLQIQYVLPKQDIRNRFVQNRINKLTRRVPIYARLVKDATAKIDNVVLKRFGNGVVNYVDSNAPGNFVEFPGDGLYVDELDRCCQANIAMAPDRLDASPHKLERYVSNPTVEGFGIHVKYQEGSQGRWHNECPKCGLVSVEFFGSVVRQLGPKEYEIIDKHPDDGDDIDCFCPKCLKPIDRYGAAEWVHAFPDRDHRSFTLEKTHSPFGTIREMAKEFFESIHDETKMQIFYNSRLGRPYTASGAKITEQMLDASRVPGMAHPRAPEGSIVYAGIDVGSYFHIVIREFVQRKGVIERPAVWIGRVKGEDDLIQLLGKYRVKVCAIDAQPEIRVVERLQKRHGGMWAVHFGPVKIPTVNKDNRYITVRRTPVADKVLEQYSNGEIKNPAGLRDIEEYVEHLTSNTRILDPDRMEFVWAQSSKPDHLFFGEVYATIAAEIAVGNDIFTYYERIADGEIGEPPREIDKETEATVYDSPESFLNQLQRRR
jgi:hypothetical protein